MKKIFLVAFISFVSVIFFSVKVDAIRVDNDEHNPSTGEVSMNIYAAPTAESSAVQLRLDVIGATVVDFSPVAEGKYLTIGTCITGGNFSSTNVCVDYATTEGVVESGDLLGELILKQIDGYNEIVINKGVDNAYLSTDYTLIPDNGVLYKSVIASTAKVKGLADTSFTIREPNSLGINTGAIILVALGVVIGALLGTTLTTLSHVLTYNAHQNRE